MCCLRETIRHPVAVPADSRRAGFRARLVGCGEDSGSYLNEGLIDDPDVDLLAPEALVYRHTAAGLELGGVEDIRRVEHGVPATGSLDGNPQGPLVVRA